MSKRKKLLKQRSPPTGLNVLVYFLILVLAVLAIVGFFNYLDNPKNNYQPGTHEYLTKTVFDLTRGIPEAEELYDLLLNRSERFYLPFYNPADMEAHKERLKREKRFAFVIVKQHWVKDQMKGVPFAGIIEELNTLYIFESPAVSDYALGLILIHELKHTSDYLQGLGPGKGITKRSLDFELAAYEIQAMVADKLTKGELDRTARRLALGKSYSTFYVEMERKTFLEMDKLFPPAKTEEQWVRQPVYLYIYNRAIGENSGLRGEDLRETMRNWYLALLKYHGYG